MNLQNLPKKNLAQLQERKRVRDALVHLGLTPEGAKQCLKEIFPDEWHSVPEMAERLGISVQGVWYQVRRGQLKAYQFQGHAIVAPIHQKSSQKVSTGGKHKKPS